MTVGLTGGIGSGKSIVVQIFQLLGAFVFNSDDVAKELYFDETIRPKIIALLGEDAYLSEKSITKRYISTKIFNDPAMLLQLNAIIHPAVIERSKFSQNNMPAKLLLKNGLII